MVFKEVQAGLLVGQKEARDKSSGLRVCATGSRSYDPGSCL